MLFTPNFETKIWTLRRNQDSSDQATFFWSSIIDFWWARVKCSFWFLFLADSSGTWCGLCSSPSTSMFDRSCVQRCSSVNPGCNKLLFELLLPSYQLRSFSLFSSDTSKAYKSSPLLLLLLCWQPAQHFNFSFAIFRIFRVYWVNVLLKKWNYSGILHSTFKTYSWNYKRTFNYQLLFIKISESLSFF